MTLPALATDAVIAIPMRIALPLLLLGLCGMGGLALWVRRRLREVHEILDRTTDYVVQTDTQGAITYMNPAARQALGLAPQGRLGRHHFHDFAPEAVRGQFARDVIPAVRTEGLWLGETALHLGSKGEVPLSHMVIAHRDSRGRISHFSSVMRDISGDVGNRHKIQRQADILSAITEAIPATVVVVGADGRYRFVNHAFERYCGRSRQQIIGRTAADVLGMDEIERRRPWMKRAFAGEAVDFTLEYPSPHGSTHLALSCIPLRLDGEVDGFVGISQDITAQKREEARLTQLVQRDSLTGLLNRAGFEQQLEQHVADGHGASLALLYIDLDHFKPVNDRHGHPAGDLVLQSFAARINHVVRATDAVARLGGDEFAILLAGVREDAHAQIVADKVLAAARAPFEIGGRFVTVSASVGVAYGVDPALGWPDLVSRADARLYEAKDAGRGRQAGARSAA